MLRKIQKDQQKNTNIFLRMNRSNGEESDDSNIDKEKTRRSRVDSGEKSRRRLIHHEKMDDEWKV